MGSARSKLNLDEREEGCIYRSIYSAHETKHRMGLQTSDQGPEWDSSWEYMVLLISFGICMILREEGGTAVSWTAELAVASLLHLMPCMVRSRERERGGRQTLSNGRECSRSDRGCCPQRCPSRQWDECTCYWHGELWARESKERRGRDRDIWFHGPSEQERNTKVTLIGSSLGALSAALAWSSSLACLICLKYASVGWTFFLSHSPDTCQLTIYKNRTMRFNHWTSPISFGFDAKKKVREAWGSKTCHHWVSYHVRVRVPSSLD